MQRGWCVVVAWLGFTGCAVLHRATVSEIEPVEGAREIDVKISETGFNVQGTAHTTNILAQKYGNNNAKSAGAWIDFLVAMSSWSPATGNPTMSEDWADRSRDALRDSCPKGRVTNIQVLRESARYPLVSGEIVRMHAYCVGGVK